MHEVQKKKTSAEAQIAAAGQPDTLRARKHEFVLQEIERSAWELFAEVGFDRATIDEISRRAGVSRRTFFRYFPTKEDLLSYSLESFGRRLRERLAAIPAGREAEQAMEEAFLSLSREKMEDHREPKEMLGLMFQEPCLRGRFLYGISLWVPELAEELLRRKAFKGDAARCRLMAALYCTAFDQAHLSWYREGGADLHTYLRRAFRQLRQIGQSVTSR